MKMFYPLTLAAGIFVSSGFLPAQAIDIDVNVNVKHTVGGISTFDRSKFITIHSSHTDREWTDHFGANFTNDLLAAFFKGNDVYFGRDTGYISWELNNDINEDPSMPGWARLYAPGDNYTITSQGSNSRNSYNSKTEIHPYESRAATDIMCAQFHTFWPGSRDTKRGWGISETDTASEPFGSATGHFMGHFLSNYYATAENGYVGRPLTPYVEIMNEPDWPLLDYSNDPMYGTATPAEIWQFHNTVADQIRSIKSDVLVGGYVTTFPDFEENNFQEWDDQWRLFIDMCATNMDFYSVHLYDFDDGTKLFRKGSNLEATLDMIEHYSDIKIGTPLPFVVSEYGGRDRRLEGGEWSAFHDWVQTKSKSSMLMSFMDRPDLMYKTIPFIVCKGEWGRGGAPNYYPYTARLMRQANEPASYTGDWVYTDKVRFYELWSDVNGTRVDSTTSDPDIQVDAYVDGSKAYVILNNLDQAANTVDLNLSEYHGSPVQSVLEKNMYWNGSSIALDQTLHSGNLAQVQLGSEGTAILEYSFASPVNVDETSDEVKYYASTYFQFILGGFSSGFQINGVSKGVFGEAVLRLGMGRAKVGASKKPVVTVNGTAIPVPTDFMGHEGDSRSTFFGQLDIPVPYNLLQSNNTISITFPDSGGYVSSVSLRAYEFSTDVRNGGPEPPAGSVITSTEVSGNDLILAVSNGVPHGTFDVMASTDLTIVSNWVSSLLGAQFDGAGEATVTNPVSESHEFYRIREPGTPVIPVAGVSVSPGSDALPGGEELQ